MNRTPQLITIASGGTFTIIRGGYRNVAIVPAAGATVAVLNEAGQTLTVSIPITLGGDSGDNGFEAIWGEITITSTGESTNLIIDGNI